MIKGKVRVPKVCIIILNWNGWKDTIECLESVYQIDYPNYEVIVVDNGSENESLEMMRGYCKSKIEATSKSIPVVPHLSNKPIEVIEYTREVVETSGVQEIRIENLPPNKKLIIIKNEKNYGFAEGNNIAIRYAMKILNPEYILLLNNDTVVDKKVLGALVEVAEIDKKIGMVGPKVYYYDLNGRTDVINFAGGKLNMRKGQSFHIGIAEIDIGQYDEMKQVDYIEGSALLVKKNVLNKIGLIDSSYFAYWEDNDLCSRAFKAGYICMYVPNSKIWHKISSSDNNSTKDYYMTRNRFRFMKKNATKLQLSSFLVYFFGFQFWLICGAFLLHRRDLAGSVSFFKSIVDGLFGSEMTK
jgi:GT2 family glycosyltransferase